MNTTPPKPDGLRELIGDVIEYTSIAALAIVATYLALSWVFGDPADPKADRLDLNTTVIEKNQP